MAAGVGTAITGRGADVALIDDPVKDRQEADSDTFRKRAWDWYTSTLYTRLMPGGAVVLIQTRWHEDDLAGRLLSWQETRDKWTVLNLPALNDAGEALWPEWFPVERLEQIRAAVGQRDWEALYQQRPVPDTGGIFKRDWFQVVDAAPVQATRCRFWDCAGTAGGGDYTVGAKVAHGSDGLWYLEHVIRGQFGPHEVKRIVAQTAAADGKSTRIRIEQEPGSSGKMVIADFIRDLAGFDVRGLPATGEKSLRWRPLAAQAEAGNVRMVRGAWNVPFLDEMAIAPFGKHDDQCDSVSGAFNELAANRAVLKSVVGF